MMENNLPNTPNIEVIQDGERISPQVRPDVMNFIMLAKMVRDIGKIKKYFDDRIPEGRAFHRILTVTPTTIIIDLSQQPLQSVAFYNTGPTFSAFVRINDWVSDRVEIGPGDTKRFNFELHKIEWLYIDCNPGETTTLDITGDW